jgi:hypothetical protein
LRYARRFGFSPDSFALVDEWEPIQAVLTTKYGVPAITNDAIRRQRRPVDFSDADLELWAGATLDAGGSYQYVTQAQSAFLTAIREALLEGRFPTLDVAVCRLPSYRLRIKDMPEPLRTQVSEIVASRRAQAELGMASMAFATECEIFEHFEDFCGYAVGVLGIDVVDLDPLLNEPFVRKYAFWLHNERKCKRTTVTGKLSRMVSVLQSSPRFQGRDFRWMYSIYRKLRKEPESALKGRRRLRDIEFQALAAVPGRMSCERSALREKSPESSGWRIMDELLLTCLILAQWPPRFVREATIGRNIFKGTVPKNGPPFKTPEWADEILSKNPDAEFWQFRYESQQGQLHRGLVLRRLVPLLELYLNECRPLLVGAGNAASLFMDRSGRPLTCGLLGKHVSYLLWRYVKRRVTLTSIRSSFAYYWREKYPYKDAVLAQIQWVDYATIKMRYDEEFRNQRYARMNLRKSRYS